MGVGIVYLTDLVWIDPLVAILFGLNILVSALRLIRSSLTGLLDEADPIQTNKLIECLQTAVNEAKYRDFINCVTAVQTTLCGSRFTCFCRMKCGMPWRTSM